IRRRRPLRDPPRLRHRRLPPGLGVPRRPGHRQGRPPEAGGLRPGVLRLPAGCDHPQPRPAAAHLQGHQLLRPLRPARQGRVLLGRGVPAMVVRAPLRGRRVRGWVLAVSQGPQNPDGAGSDTADAGDGLVDLAGVSGPAPVFDVGLLGTAYAMARRYVHPLSSFLHLMTPPQMLGRARGLPAAPPRRSGGPGATRTLRRLGPREDPAAIYAGAIRQALAEGRGAMVVLPEFGGGSLS